MTRLRHLLLRHRVTLVTGAIGVIAFVATWVLVLNETGAGELGVNWPAFAVISVMLLACERTPAAWVRLGPAGVVTPL